MVADTFSQRPSGELGPSQPGAEPGLAHTVNDQVTGQPTAWAIMALLDAFSSQTPYQPFPIQAFIYYGLHTVKTLVLTLAGRLWQQARHVSPAHTPRAPFSAQPCRSLLLTAVPQGESQHDATNSHITRSLGNAMFVMVRTISAL